MIATPDPIGAMNVALVVFAVAAVLIVVFDVVLWLAHGNEGTISRGVWLTYQRTPGRVVLVLCCVAAVFGGLVVHWLGL